MKRLTTILGIKYPIIMAPMFLVTNTRMMIAALNSNIAACIPALNYRTDQELRDAILQIRNETTTSALGINLIVNKSNVKLQKQLETCAELEVDFIITSLGNPKKVLDICKPKGIKVFCDVINIEMAKKVQNLNADGIIAVNNSAGGHLGKLSATEIINQFKNEINIPVISAGGIGTKAGIDKKIDLGFSGVSIGSPFIACEEADISKEYKNACVNYGKKDIVISTKISGSPCTVINTPYVQKIGTQQNWLESILSKNKKLKKWVKMITFLKGMRSVEKAAFSSTYKTVWCAGPSIEHTKEILPTKEIIKRLTT
ncbi:MAG: nitronate monooxygenase [Bacteroidota bacterium]|nr:nitronate monooxygenase [Bacteroidota bacterium]